jgi:hypothetical protein
MTDSIRVQRGRLVRETWVTWAKRQRRPKPSWLVPFDDLDADQREVNMLIGEAVAEAERARIAELAAKHEAWYIPDCRPGECGPVCGKVAPFADLIRKERGHG